MKVIIIKECKEGKVDQIIDVSNGYAKNFLIKNGYALPVNSKTSKILQSNINKKETTENKNIENAHKVKLAIENLVLRYKLKVSNDLVHGSVSRKHIHNDLRKKGIKIDGHAIRNSKINTLGISFVEIKVYKNIMAELKVEVIKDGE